ncbi:MAG: Wzz/FepE/Etk N-terminal domain-containing protein, partial [Gemmatimonadaceae bacterium]
MRDRLVPVESQSNPLAAPGEAFGSDYAPPPPATNPIERPLAAVRRYKWLILAVTIISSGLGVVATKLIAPEYEVGATVWVAVNQRQGGQAQGGPIRSQELLGAGQAWVELFRTPKVVDEVVRKLVLYVTPENAADKPGFASFSLAERYAPGNYELIIDRTAKKWILTGLSGIEIERGAPADSVGRKVGFKWQVPENAFEGAGERRIKFSVITPREMSQQVVNNVGNRVQQGSNFLWLTYRSPDPQLAARTLNTWLNEFVQVAATLKRGNVVEYSSILEEQLRFAEQSTQAAEAAYQNFRVNTILLPTDGGPVAARGIENERDPALASFFEQKIEHDNLRNDREALE